MATPFIKRSARSIAAMLFTALLVSAGQVVARGDDAVLGLWRTEPTDQGYAQVEITRQGGRLRGVIVSLSEPLFPDREGPEWAGKPKVDRQNPDAEKRQRSIIGLEIVWGFEAKGKGRWHRGRVYDPENGKTYKAKLTLKADGSLDLRGYVGISILGRTSTWTRVASP